MGPAGPERRAAGLSGPSQVHYFSGQRGGARRVRLKPTDRLVAEVVIDNVGRQLRRADVRRVYASGDSSATVTGGGGSAAKTAIQAQFFGGIVCDTTAIAMLLFGHALHAPRPCPAASPPTMPPASPCPLLLSLRGRSSPINHDPVKGSITAPLLRALVDFSARGSLQSGVASATGSDPSFSRAISVSLSR